MPIRNGNICLALAAAFLLLLVGAATAAGGSRSFDPAAAAGEEEEEHHRRRRRPEGGKTRRPNILLLLTDDQDVLLGGLSHMPLLRRHLIDGGTTFRNAFVHTPVCCPSRSSILSGRYLHNGGAVNNSVEGNCYGERWKADAERETFAVYAQRAGYRTSYAGKYLNRYPQGDDGHGNVPPGWDKWMGLVGNSRYYDYEVVVSDDGGNANATRRERHGHDYGRDYLPDLVANRTLAMVDEFLAEDEDDAESGGGDSPFLAVLAWPTPHGPFTPAPWAKSLYDGATAPRTENWNASSEHMLDKHWIMRQLAPIDPSTEKFIDETFASRLEALRSVDEHIDRLFHMLKSRGALDETVVLYTSDNGFQLGQHRLRVDKRHLYEYDIRVPFLAAGGSVPRGAIVEDPVLNVDIAPTIRELVAGGSSVDPSANMDGISFARYLAAGNPETQRSSPIREDFLVSYHGEGDPACGMAECPFPVPPEEWHGGWEPDSYNNTYRCVRTLKPPSGPGGASSNSVLASETGGGGGGVAVAEERRAVVDAIPEQWRRRANDADYYIGNTAAASNNGNGGGGGSSDNGENTIYCRFDDDEKFGEYYDLSEDEWEMTNRYERLTDDERDRYEARLGQLSRCRGDSCRTLPPPPVLPRFNVSVGGSEQGDDV